MGKKEEEEEEEEEDGGGGVRGGRKNFKLMNLQEDLRLVDRMIELNPQEESELVWARLPVRNALQRWGKVGGWVGGWVCG